jgi:LEA14-like dessication related protein
MKSLKFHGLILGAILVLLLAQACAPIISPTIQGFSKFKPQGKQEGKKGGFELGVEVYNPNPYRIKLVAYDLQVFVNGAKCGDAHSNDRQLMDKRATSTMLVHIETDLKQVLGGVLGVLSGLATGKKGIDLKVVGTVTAKMHGVRKTVPIEYQKQTEFSGF